MQILDKPQVSTQAPEGTQVRGILGFKNLVQSEEKRKKKCKKIKHFFARSFGRSVTSRERLRLEFSRINLNLTTKAVTSIVEDIKNLNFVVGYFKVHSASVSKLKMTPKSVGIPVQVSRILVQVSKST